MLIYGILYFINNYPDDEEFLHTQSHLLSNIPVTQLVPHQYLIDTIYANNIMVKENDKNPILPVLLASKYCTHDPYRIHPNIYRYATGQIGTFIDEKISIALPDNTRISLPLQYGNNLTLDFYIVSTSKNNAPKNIKVLLKDEHSLKIIYSTVLYPYTRSNQYHQLSKKFNDISSQTGWQHISVPIGTVTKKSHIVFSTESVENDGITFIGYPVVYTISHVKQYNVIYLIFDAMAKKYIGIYNPDSKLTPFIDSLKEKWIIFDNMHTTGVKTRIFISSFLTSQLPPATRHGINFNYIPEEEKALFYNDTAITTLPKSLHEYKYSTLQVGNSGFANPILITGIDYGFDMSFEYQKNPHNTTGITYHLMRTLQQVGNRPFFIYSHFNTTHKPRRTPMSYYIKGLIAHPELSWRPNATGATLFADATFKQIYNYLQKTNLLENTIIILTADHGTAYDINHYGNNYNHKDYTDIPFLVLLPKELQHTLKTPNRIATHCLTIDVVPTLLDLLGLDINPRFIGKSLLPELEGKRNALYTHDFIHSYDNFSYSCIYKGRWKYILLMQSKENFRHRPFLWFGSGIEEACEQLYDLEKDPNEYYNVSSSYPDIVNSIRNNFLHTSYYPELTVLSFFPEMTQHTPDIYSIHITTGGTIITLHSLIENKTNNLPFNNNNAIINLKVQQLPSYIVIGTKPANAMVNIAIFKNNKLADKNSIYYGNFDFPLQQNPIVINSNNAIAFKAFSRKKENSVIKEKSFIHIMRIDMRRWIDTENLINTEAIDTNMKQVLKSWGYIQ